MIFSALKRFGALLARAFDLRDAFLLIGLILLAAGLALVWRPAALIAPGAILIYVALFGARTLAENEPD